MTYLILFLCSNVFSLLYQLLGVLRSLSYNRYMLSRFRWPFSFGLLTLMSLPAAYPFITGNLPRTNDLASHVYRAFELEQLLRSGVFFPRWGPHLVHGYGYPVFNFFPYLSHYLISVTHMATGMDYLWAYRVVALGVTILAGWGAYLCAGDFFRDESAGLLAAIAYVYSPYLLMTANVRGGLPESLALAALPFALWAWGRAARRATWFIVLGGVSYAVIILSHNGSALQLSPVLLAYALWRGRGQHWRFSVVYISATAALGLCLSAFYWLPALLELDYVQVAAGYASTGIIYYNNFTPLSGLFSYPPVPVDSDLLNPPVSSPVAFITLTLAILTCWRASAQKRGQREVLFLGLLYITLLFLVLPQSRWIWDSMALLQLTLWPWRFIGPASLTIAILAAGIVTLQTRGKIPVLLICISLLIINGIPWFYPPREPLASPQSTADLAGFEMPPWLIGTSTTAEYLPVWVQQLPDSTAQRDALFSDPDPDRLHRERLASGVMAEHTLNQLLRDEYRIVAEDNSTLTFRQFYFPGWHASIDGIPVQISVTRPHGLMSVHVPSGEHKLTLSFGSTQARRWAGGVSLVALVVAIASAFVFAAEATPMRWRSMQMQPVWLLTIIWIPLFLYSARVENPLRRHGLAPGNQPLSMDNVLGIDFGGEIWLHGYTISTTDIPADGEVQLDLYWQAQRQLGLVYGFNVRMRDQEDRLWNSSDIVRPQGWRFMPGTDFWPPEKYVLDNYALRPLPGTPPGEYQLEVVAFRKDTLQPLHSAHLGSLQITKPDRSSFAGELPLVLLGDEWWMLRDFRIDRMEAAPGDLIGIHAVWEGVGVVTERRNVRIRVESLDGDYGKQFDFDLSPSYPPGRWLPGEALRDQYIFRLPASIPEGEYKWRMIMLRPDGSQVGEFVPSSTIKINVPVRRFDFPSDTERLDVTLGEIAELAGYNLDQRTVVAGDNLALTLVWSASSEIPDSYRVFVHLLDDNNELRAQSDGEPAGWARPTSGWMPGEYVSDYHNLALNQDLKPGRYSLHVGMYHPQSGQRLVSSMIPDGSILVVKIDVLAY